MNDFAEQACDLLVIGSGAGGLATAVTAAWLGLNVVVAEKEPYFGGTTAWSGGWMWIPRNSLARQAGIDEQIEAPRSYLQNELSDGYNADLVDMLLHQGPRMVDFFRRETALDFIDGNAIPDFHDQSIGAGFGGRSICAAPFDGRRLGARIRDLRLPLVEASPFGMGIASGADMRHFLNAFTSSASFLHVAKRFARHFNDLIFHGRGMHLVNGNALAAALLKSAEQLGVILLKSAPAVGLLQETGRIAGAFLTLNGKSTLIRANRGVVLAAGGFPHDPVRQASLIGNSANGRNHWSAALRANTGDGLRLGEDAGGVVRTDLAQPVAWAPVSLVPRQNGEVAHFPHLIERAKPGLIMVRRNGRRFCNEADSYHDVICALNAATPSNEAVEAWMICDADFIKRYGLGRVRPWPFPQWPWIRNGYLKRGQSLYALAEVCGIDSAGLKETLNMYNRNAAEGRDPAYKRGESAYNKVQGDAAHKPNPCVAPIQRAPFFAVKILPGSLGTFSGLHTDQHARVLDAAKTPIKGLYAVGNDMASIMAGRYPAGGITLGPAMTFGFVAAHDAAGVPLENNHT